MNIRHSVLVMFAAAMLGVGAQRNGCADEQGKTPSDAPRFTHPTEITNPYFPLSSLKQDIVEGNDEDRPVRVERTRRAETKTFTVEDQTVQAMTVEDRCFASGRLQEVAFKYFAQSDDGTVYFFGQDVDVYRSGKVVSHEGARLYGVHTKHLGIIVPAHPKVGDEFVSENVPGITREDDEIVSLTETVTVPAGTYKDCLKIRQDFPGMTGYKYYAPHVGVIKEVIPGGAVNLKSHN
jgi:hypothetical protein